MFRFVIVVSTVKIEPLPASHKILYAVTTDSPLFYGAVKLNARELEFLNVITG